eukprot:TRINITY_DN52419_c0_g1_i1.p1 TRINITY_DN52419_c0_g1~~TRINITY_DN52419_c0_g1_i1.p1  ORF type:complete len:709 (-),score=158.35 TRINITY_DN52419_c0_g1_i1:24-1847(-)
MLEKLWAHRQVRETLLSIPEGTRIVNGNSVDPFFGTGPDGCGENVIGAELHSLREFFTAFPKRRQLLLKVSDVGEPFEPFSAFVDVTGVAPGGIAVAAASVLSLTVGDILEVQLLTDGGFDKAGVDDFSSLQDLEQFLARNEDDCELEVRLVDVAVVTLWNAADDNYLGRTDVRHLCPTPEALRKRLESLAPLLAYEAFTPSITFAIDGSEPQELSASSMERIVQEAQNMADVLISAHYAIPEAYQSPLQAPTALDSARVELGMHTCLSSSDLSDRLRGLIWGAALGDAVGLATEFMNKEEAAQAYPDRSKLSPASRVEDRHRSRWMQGDWTDDTDQLILLLDAVIEGNGIMDQKVFARSLKHWKQHGFPELGDSSGLGIGQTVNGVLEHQVYDVAPEVAATSVWRQSGCSMAANGAVMRCASAAVARFWDEAVVTHNAVSSASITHPDPRCTASCVAIASIAARVLQGVSTSTPERRQEEVMTAVHHAGHFLDGGDADELFKNMVVPAEGLESLKLGSGGIGYTYKPLAAACWAFVHADSFEDAIQAITMEAGDADSNATVAGALLGVRLGFSKLPKAWLNEIPEMQQKWLSQKISACLRLSGLES